jgi:hypothetical protein
VLGKWKSQIWGILEGIFFLEEWVSMTLAMTAPTWAWVLLHKCSEEAGDPHGGNSPPHTQPHNKLFIFFVFRGGRGGRGHFDGGNGGFGPRGPPPRFRGGRGGFMGGPGPRHEMNMRGGPRGKHPVSLHSVIYPVLIYCSY